MQHTGLLVHFQKTLWDIIEINRKPLVTRMKTAGMLCCTHAAVWQCGNSLIL